MTMNRFTCRYNILNTLFPSNYRRLENRNEIMVCVVEKVYGFENEEHFTSGNILPMLRTLNARTAPDSKDTLGPRG